VTRTRRRTGRGAPIAGVAATAGIADRTVAEHLDVELEDVLDLYHFQTRRHPLSPFSSRHRRPPAEEGTAAGLIRCIGGRTTRTASRRQGQHHIGMRPVGHPPAPRKRSLMSTRQPTSVRNVGAGKAPATEWASGGRSRPRSRYALSGRQRHQCRTETPADVRLPEPDRPRPQSSPTRIGGPPQDRGEADANASHTLWSYRSRWSATVGR